MKAQMPGFLPLLVTMWVHLRSQCILAKAISKYLLLKQVALYMCHVHSVPSPLCVGLLALCGTCIRQPWSC
jgi:hypothetical protein